LKLAVFPLDDIEQYIKKGFVQPNYYNPNNIFNKIYIFNPSNEKEIDNKLVQSMCGTANYQIIFLGQHNAIQKILYLHKTTLRCIEEINIIKPDCIRTYGMLFNSYIASECAEITKTPLVLSIHDNYDDVRRREFKSNNIINIIFYQLWKRVFETKIITKATKVIAMYKFAKEYAMNTGAKEKDIKIIYNKINIEQFKPLNKIIPKYETFTILTVLRQIKIKNQQTIIKAIANLKDVNLILIGNGNEHNKLIKLTKKLKCSHKVTFITKVLNQNLPIYYQKSHLFASSVIHGGVGIPILESMACGLPVIHAKYPHEPKPDILSACTVMVKNTPKDFANAITLLKQDKDLYNYYSNMGIKFTELVNNKTMNKKEEILYQEVINKWIKKSLQL